MHTQWESLANEHILGIAPYEPGKPIEELERELGIARRDQARVEREPAAAVRARPAGDHGGAGAPQPLSGRQRLLPAAGARPSSHGVSAGPGRPRQRLQRADRARSCGRSSRPGDEAVVPHPSFVVYPMIVQAVGRDPRDGDAEGLPARPRGDGARHHADDQDGLHRQPEQPHRHHRDRRRGRALHGARARPRPSWSSTRPTSSSPRAPTFPTRSTTSSRAARSSCCGRSRRRRASPGCAWATASPMPTPSRS